jgi:hypothetical protein
VLRSGRNQNTAIDGDDGRTWRDAGKREPSGESETAVLAHVQAGAWSAEGTEKRQRQRVLAAKPRDGGRAAV